MATKKQKAELIEILKFTPIKVQMTIQGYGGETYAGRVDRNIYEYFKSRKLDLNQYASDWDNEMKVPDEMQPFPPGSAYECDNMFHASGAELSDLNRITVTDEKGNTIWEHDLGWSSLEEDGVVVEQFSDVDFDNLSEGEVAFWGGQGEKGCFFDCEFTLTQPFDPKKLVIKFETCDGWHIINYVEYDGEDLDGSGGYSTTGKWSENKWILGGNEEVYEDEEFDPDEAEEQEVSEWPEVGDEDVEFDPVNELDKIWEDQKTDWFDISVKPRRKGQYECEFESATWPFPIERMCEWTGRTWKENGEKAVGIKRWRGLKFDPNEVMYEA